MRRADALGLATASLSAAMFGTSGALATPLLDAGWTAGGAVTVRIAVAAVLLTPFAVFSVRRSPVSTRGSAPAVVIYGVVALAGCQWCYFNAIEHVPVGVALLLEYSGALLVVIWTWLRHGQRPGPATIAGVALSVAGLFFVLDVFGGGQVNIAGVLWGLGAAVGLAVYYVVSSGTDVALPPVVFAWASMIVGAITLALAGLIGAVPFAASTRDVHLLGHPTSVLVPVLGIALIATAAAYSTGIAAARVLGARVASFVGLAEVLFAVLWAWLLLRQAPTALQCLGGVLVLGGIVLVRAGDVRPDPVIEPAQDHQGEDRRDRVAG